MNGLYADQNIGEMFHDIVNDIKEQIPDKVSEIQNEIGESGFKINWPKDEPLWEILIAVAAVLIVVIIGVSICSASKKKRMKKALSVGPYPNTTRRAKCPANTQADADELFAQIERNIAINNGEPLDLDFDEPVDEPVEDLAEEYVEAQEPIKVEKIEVITQAPAKKYGPGNYNVSRSGKVYTEDELRKLIRK